MLFTEIVPPFVETSSDKAIVPVFAPSPPKESLFKTLIVLFVESSLTVMMSAIADGVSFIELTVILIFTVDVSPFASVIVYLITSVPLKLAKGE